MSTLKTYILEKLPYTKPFLFVDEIFKVDDNGIEGAYTFKEDEYFYEGHFKELPITPGVILTECMAQIGLVSLGIYLLKDVKQKDVLVAFSESHVEFLKTVKPKETKRVVVTGLGICAPNGIGIPEFWKNTKLGVSGIRFIPQLRELNFTCQIAAQPQVTQEHINARFTKLEQRGLNSTGIVYGVLAGLEAWEDADLLYNDTPDYDTGIIFGTGILGVDKFREAIHKIDAGNTRRLGSTSVLQTMASGISTYLNSKLGCGNQVTTNSSACSTGTEAVLMAYDRIKSGQAKRILVGSCSDSGPYVWGGFDAMRILPHDYNDKPTEASRPMSATASGFVPGSGAGALVIESLESAKKRGAKIYAEISGGHLNSGGQLAGGSMTAPNGQAVRRCISKALKESRVQHDALSAINGHLTATKKDSEELYNWKRTLKMKLLNSHQ